MESDTFSLEQLKEARDHLLNDGFHQLDHSVSAAEHLLQMEEDRFPWHKQSGLEFCEQHVLKDERIQQVNRANLGEKYVLVHWMRQQAYPGHILCYTKGGPKAGLRSHQVHIWAIGSECIYRRGGHLHDLPASVGRRSVNEIDAKEYDEVGCPGILKTFNAGGTVIMDSRDGFEIRKGYVIVFEFALENLAWIWRKMALPSSERLKQKVHDMEESTNIKLNFSFESNPPPASS